VRRFGRFSLACDALDMRLRDCAVGDRFDFFLFADLPRDRPAFLSDPGRDLFRGCGLSERLEVVVARLTAFRIGCLPAAPPARAPTTPPTTAPIGPATLPIAAPVTAPAVCFRIGGIWISSDDCELSFFFRFR
jgi:hypothetical protein